MESLADFLGVRGALAGRPEDDEDRAPSLLDITDPQAFAQAVLGSLEFRMYIVNGLCLGNLPGFTTLLGRLMDHAWGKPVERVEHTGKDGQPIESVTEVRRVIIRKTIHEFDHEREREAPTRETTH